MVEPRGSWRLRFFHDPWVHMDCRLLLKTQNPKNKVYSVNQVIILTLLSSFTLLKTGPLDNAIQEFSLA